MTGDEARTKILDATCDCLLRFGTSKTTVQDVARETGVHRSTVYEYFPGREALLVGVLSRESGVIFRQVSRHFDDHAFVPGLVEAIAEGSRLVRESPILSALLSPDSSGQTISATTASQAWDDLIQKALTPPLTKGVAQQEIRQDVPVTDLARWIVRVALSVTSEPPDDIRLTLVRFLAPALTP